MTVHTSETYNLEDEFTKEQYETEMDSRGKALKWVGRFNVLEGESRTGGKPYIVGLDTETFESSGNLLCLCNSYDDTVLIGGAKWNELNSMQSIYQYLMNIKRKIRNEKETEILFLCFGI